ncbi:DUF3667 domain-containing protein [Pedobacter polaris]|uniref:DUF3667 domain-containing protein n=1 Tax=Pedobacter polaris TaxID=2571273 RepID=A0A4U1CGJ4_9SPHI|nr:DUF3667 domain-containing protein [Pedobacter polaris]TKC05525.1 DUF3667 domain-containing protein [Pedobacter polaris]
MNTKHCLNCEHNLDIGQKFCSQCGQEAHVHRFTLTHFFHEVFHAFTHADKGIFYLLKELFIRPGIVAKEYIAGKRKKYFSPFTFFLILAAFYVLSDGLSSTVKKDDQTTLIKIAEIPDPEKRQEATIIYHRAMKSQQFFVKNGNILAMIAVPFFSFYFWLIYYRKKYNYSEHLVANLMFISFANLAFTLLVHPLRALLKETSWVAFAPLLGLLLQLIYFVIAYKDFVDLKGPRAIFKVIMVTLIGLLLWAFLTQIASAIYVYQSLNFMDYFKHMGRR